MTGSSDLHVQHLDSETIHLFLSGELPERELAKAKTHLAGCEACQTRLDETAAALDEVGLFDGVVAQSRLHARVMEHRQSRVRRFLGLSPSSAGLLLGSRSFATAASIAALIVLGLFWFTSNTAEAKATELLRKAVVEQSRATQRPRYIRMRSRNAACLIPAVSTPRVARDGAPTGDCRTLQSRFSAVNWDWENPLSAQSFENWRESLPAKHDAVTVLSGAVEIQTTTSASPLRKASLRLRNTDYLPTQAHFEFSGQDPIDIIEEDQPPVLANAPLETQPVTIVPPTAPQSTLPELPRDPAGEAEIQVFERLHAVDADRGYEVSVRRGQDRIEVLGVVATDGRRTQILAALQDLPFLRAEIKTYAERQPGDSSFLPRRDQTGSLPALAQEWLRTNWPGQTARGQFTADLLAASQRALGEATALDELRGAQARLAQSPDVARLEPIAQEHQHRMLRDLAAIQAAVQPLTGPLVPIASPLTAEKAAILDSCLLRLFYLAAEGDSQEAEIERLRSVFQ